MNLPDEPYTPTAELARLHLRNVITHVLGRPPVQGKAAFERIEKELASEYFPSRAIEAVEVLQEGPLARPREKLIEKTVWHCLKKILEPGDHAKLRSRAAGLICALQKMHPEMTNKYLSKAASILIQGITDDQMSIMPGLVARIGGLWSMLGNGAQVKIIKYLKTSKKVFKDARFSQLAGIDELSTVVRQRVAAADIEELSSIVANGGGQLCTERAVELFSTVSSWRVANEIGDSLISPLAPILSLAQIEAIIRAPRERDADLVGSGGFARFLQKILERSDIDRSRVASILKQENLDEYVEEAEEVSKAEVLQF